MIQILNILLLSSYCGLIYWLSDQSSLQTPLGFYLGDKIIHAAAYFIMAVFAWLSFFPFFNNRVMTAISVLGFCSVFGYLDEWHQSFVPGRVSDPFDWYADMLGAVIAILGFYKTSFWKTNLV